MSAEQSISIRRLIGADAGALRELRLKSLQGAPEAFSSSYEEELERPFDWFSDVAAGTETNATFGAFYNGWLVGMAGFVAATKSKERHKGILVGMYVRDDFRRRGIARRLLRAVIEHAAGHVTLLHATVNASNAAACALYRASGFRTYGTEPKALCVEGRLYDADLLVLDLQSGRDPKECSQPFR